ncbi:MAG: alpha/beta hydrolase [Acidimicrobiales bacterium]
MTTASAIGVAVAVAACSTAPSPVRTGPGTSNLGLPAVAPPQPIHWVSCSGNPVFRCGSVSVPIDYHHPRNGSLEIAVSELPALDPSAPGGTLFFNPGGPGESGNQILPVVTGLFPAAVRRKFTIVTFDPRGTGASSPLNCGTSAAATAAVPPVAAAAGQPLPGTDLFTSMAKECMRATGAEAPFVDTTNTARDMDRIRQAIGVAKLSYYGLSYGTVLGAVYAQLFPTRVLHMVLDGAVDVGAGLAQQADQQAPAAEASLEHLFNRCRAQASCPLGPHPLRFFERLAASLRRYPLPAPGGGDPVPVTVGDLDTATLLAVSVPALTAAYESALVAAARGNGTPLRSVALTFVTDIDGASLVDAEWAITCNDFADHPGPVTAGDQARALAARYPLLGGYAVTYAMGGCVSWPAPVQPLVDIHAAGAPPILVVGNTGDPNTPLIGARHLAAAIPRARLVVWDGWGHTWLLSGSQNSCMRGAVTSYLASGLLPARGTVCR